MLPARFACAVIGEGVVALACTEILRAASHDVAAVFCADRKTALELTSRGLRVYRPDSNIEATLTPTPIDWLFSIVNPRILPPRLLALPRAGTVNYHDGPLPRYAGVHATTWALLNGEARHAISWHLVAPQVDAGDILKQVEVAIDAGDTVHTLNVRCAEAAIASFRELVGDLAENRFERRPQDLSERTYFGRHLRPSGAAVLRASRPAAELDRLVRALAFGPTQNPISTAKIVWGGQVLSVGSSQQCVGSGAAPGTIVSTENGRIRFATADGDLWLGKLSTLSGRELSAADVDEQWRGARTLDEIAPETLDGITPLDEAASRREEWWVRRLSETVPPNVSWAAVGPTAVPSVAAFDEVLPVTVASVLDNVRGPADLLAALSCVLERLGSPSRVDLAWADPETATHIGIEVFARFLPVRLAASNDALGAMKLDDVRRRAIEALDVLHAKKAYALDVFSRYPELRPLATDPPLPIAVSFDAAQSSSSGSMLTLQILDEGRRWRWTYDASRIEDAQIRSLAAVLARVLVAGAATPTLPVRDLPLLPHDELERVTSTFNHAFAGQPATLAVHLRFMEQAQRTPGALAVDDGRRRFTYDELDRYSNRLARWLVRRGVTSEQCVAVWMNRSAHWIATVVGITKSGAAYCPLEPNDPATRIQTILRDARPPLLLTTGAHAGTSELGVECVDLEDPATVAEIEREVDDAPPALHGLDQLAYIIYTSGTTGVPNGVAVEHRQLAAFVAEHVQFVGLSETDRISQMSSPAFDASMSEIWPTLVSGAALHIVDDAMRVSLGAFSRWMTATGITLAGMPTLLAEEALDLAWSGRSPRFITTGGAKLNRRPTATTPFGLVNAYGPTETTVYVTTEHVEPGDHGVWSIGRPIGNTQVYVLGTDEQPLPVGFFGELWVGGANVARGYLGKPALTAEKFRPDPFRAGRLYRTGDRARWAADGRIEFGGRIDHQVKLRGFRIELGEIETALAALAGVRYAVVAVREDHPGDQRLVAYVVSVEGHVLDTSALKAALRDKVPNYMVPGAFVLMEDMPRTAGGKIDRKVLPAPESTVRAGYVAPRNPTELVVAELWQEIFHLERVGIDDDFNDIGGHSLLAMSLVGRIRERLGVEVALIEVLESPTVAKLSVWIEQLRALDEEGSAVAVSTIDDSLAEVLRERRSGTELTRAAVSQEYFWYLSQLDPDPTAYVIQAVVLLEGPLDCEAFKRSAEATVAQHSIFRTAFREVDGKLFQYVSSDVPAFELEIRNASPLSESDWPAEVDRSVNELLPRVDLSSGPRICGCLTALAPDRHMMILAVHHAVGDGASTAALRVEIFQRYEESQHGAKPRDGQPIQFIDYCEALERFSRTPTGRARREWWRSNLRGAQPLRLPVDVPRAEHDARREAAPLGITPDRMHYPYFRCQLSPAARDNVIRVARELRTTPYVIYLAGLAWLCHELTGDHDICIENTHSQRALHRDLERVQGSVTAWTIMRIDTSRCQTLRDAIGKTSQVVSAATEHGVISDYYELVPASIRRAIFNYVPLPRPAASPVTALRTVSQPRPFPLWKRPWELHLTMIDSELSTQLYWTGIQELFRRETVATLLERYLALLEHHLD